MPNLLRGVILVTVGFLFWIGSLGTIMSGVANLTGMNAILAGLAVTLVFVALALGGAKEMGVDLIGKI